MGQRQIFFGHGPLEEAVLETPRSLAPLPEDHHPRGLTIEPVRHLPAMSNAEPGVHEGRERVPEIARRRVHRQPRWFVDHEDRRVTMNLTIVHHHVRLLRCRPMHHEPLSLSHPLLLTGQGLAGVAVRHAAKLDDPVDAAAR